MFDRQKVFTLRLQEIDANKDDFQYSEHIQTRGRSCGGHIESDLAADDGNSRSRRDAFYKCNIQSA